MRTRLNPVVPRRQAEIVAATLDSATIRELERMPRCEACQKRSLPTQARARLYFAYLLFRRRSAAPRPDDFMMRAYLCPFKKGWHVGHNRNVASILKRGNQ